MDSATYPEHPRLTAMDTSQLALLNLAHLWRTDPAEAERVIDADRRRRDADDRADRAATEAEAA